MLIRFREPTSGLTHLFAAILSAAGLVWLIALTHNDTPKLLTMLIYGGSMILLYLASATYHLTRGPQKLIDRLIRLDLAGIALLIAGTYTPLTYHYLDGPWRWGMLGLVWILALGGAVYVIFLHHKRSLSLRLLSFYLGLGAVGLVGAPYFVTLLPTGALALILLGGTIYLVGAVVFALNRPNLHRYFNAHDLWHLFVMGGSACYFVVIVEFVALG